MEKSNISTKEEQIDAMKPAKDAETPPKGPSLSSLLPPSLFPLIQRRSLPLLSLQLLPFRVHECPRRVTCGALRGWTACNGLRQTLAFG